MPVVSIRHRTTYRYRNPVAFGEHRVMYRPLESFDQRVVEAEDYFIGPGTDITRMTALEVGELLIAIRIPGTFAGARFYFEKVADRNVWDFPLVNVASAMRLEGGTVQALRIAANGVSARPRRLITVEQVLAGRRPDDAALTEAGEAAIAGAEPLQHNGYKVPLLRNLVKRAIRGTEDF